MTPGVRGVGRDAATRSGGCRGDPPAGRASVDAASAGIHRPRGARVGGRQHLRRRLDLRRPRLRRQRAGRLHQPGHRCRERLRHRRRGRDAARLPQRLPSPRLADRRGSRGPGPQTAALPLPRLVLRPRGQSAGGAPHGRGRGLRHELLRVAGGAERRRRRPRPRRPRRRPARPGGRSRRRAAAEARALQRRRSPARRPPDLRGRGELEGDRRELQRVPPLPRRPPGAQRAQQLHERRERLRRRRLVRRLDDPRRWRRDDGHRRRPRRPPAADREPRGGRPAGRPLLRAVPERARLAASRLRDAAHPLAARAGPDRRDLRVLLRAGGDRRARLRPRRCGRVLEPGQRRGLACLRTEPEGGRLARLQLGPLLGRGTRRSRLRRDGRRPLYGGPARGGGRHERDRGTARRGRPPGTAPRPRSRASGT